MLDSIALNFDKKLTLHNFFYENIYIYIYKLNEDIQKNELYFEFWVIFFFSFFLYMLCLQLHNLPMWITSETRVHNIRVERRPIVRATRDKVRVICGGPVSPNYWKLFEHRKQTYRYRGESLWSRMFVLIKVHFEPRISYFLIVLLFLCMVSLTNDYYYSCYKDIYIRLTNFMNNNCWKLEYILLFW